MGIDSERPGAPSLGDESMEPGDPGDKKKKKLFDGEEFEKGDKDDTYGKDDFNKE
jgi:hypothetical protein